MRFRLSSPTKAKKGLNFTELSSVIIVFFMITIIAAIALSTTEEIKDAAGQSYCPSGYVWNVSGSNGTEVCCFYNSSFTEGNCEQGNASSVSDVNITIDSGQEGISDMIDWLDIIGLVIIAGVILGTIGLIVSATGTFGY